MGCCHTKYLNRENCLQTSSIVEVWDITDIHEILAICPEHKALINTVAALMREHGKSHTFCPPRTAPFRKARAQEFQVGTNAVTWVSLLFH